MSQPSRRIYMDVSVLSRPFDDQSQLRLRLETDAELLVLGQLKSKMYPLIVSPAHDVEIGAIKDAAEREQLQQLLDTIGSRFEFDLEEGRARAGKLVRQGVGVADAAHLAFAEQAGRDFITCDDRLIRQCKRVMPDLWCGTPIAYGEKENLR